MTDWVIDKVYNVGDMITIKTPCGSTKTYKAVINHKSSPVPSGFKSDLEKFWKETESQQLNTPTGYTAVPPKECITNDQLSVTMLTLSAGIFIGMIVSKMIS